MSCGLAHFFSASPAKMLCAPSHSFPWERDGLVSDFSSSAVQNKSLRSTNSSYQQIISSFCPLKCSRSTNTCGSGTRSINSKTLRLPRTDVEDFIQINPLHPCHFLRGRDLLRVRAASQVDKLLPVPVTEVEERNEHGGLASLDILLESSQATASPGSFLPPKSPVIRVSHIERIEGIIERTIFDCRFFTLLAVVGSLAGSILCFFKGSLFIVDSFREYFYACCSGHGTGQVILYLVEAVDVYLMGTVMLIFGMGLYELFVSSLEVAGDPLSDGTRRTPAFGSNLFGLFRLRERPKWLEIRSLDELKTKLGHVIVMILLVGMFEKSKKVPINSSLDLVCFAFSILLASGCLFLLNKLSKP